MPQSKPWYQSRVVWYNLLTLIVAGASYFGWTPNEAITSGVATAMVALSPIVNLALRFLTHKGIGPSIPSQPLA